jgi:hypothetical protein
MVGTRSRDSLPRAYSTTARSASALKGVLVKGVLFQRDKGLHGGLSLRRGAPRWW